MRPRSPDWIMEDASHQIRHGKDRRDGRIEASQFRRR